MSNGFFKMHKVIFRHFLLKRPHLCAIYNWLSVEAKHLPHQCDNREWLKPGELLIRARQIAADFGMTRQKIYKLLSELQEIGLIEIERREWGSKVKVIYFDPAESVLKEIAQREPIDMGLRKRRDTYSDRSCKLKEHLQSDNNTLISISNEHSSSIQTLRLKEEKTRIFDPEAIETPLIAEIEARQRGVEIVQGLIEEIKREGPPPAEFPLEWGGNSSPELIEPEVILGEMPKKKRVRKKKATEELIEAPPHEATDLAERWYRWVEERGSWRKGMTIHAFASALTKIARNPQYTIKGAAKYSFDVLNGMFEFIKTHKFWPSVAVSPCRLTEKNKAGVEKIYNIYEQMLVDPRFIKFKRDQNLMEKAKKMSEQIESGNIRDFTIDDIDNWGEMRKTQR